MKKSRVTINDVARAAGVSLMTVSRAINGQTGIGEKTRKRILDLAHQMNYQPSQIARSLATRQTRTLGLVIPDVSNPFFALIARGAEDAAYENGFSVFLVNSSENQERERSALDSLWQKEVDGVLLCSPRLPEDELLRYYDRFPQMVVVNRQLTSSHPNVSTVNVDDKLGAQLVVKHFQQIGRTHFALIAGPESSHSAQRRKEGFLASVKSAHLPFTSSQIVHCPPTVQGGLEAALQLLEQHPEIDAISAYNDLVAIGVLQACKQQQKEVPASIAVVGVDDIPLASLVHPTLSSLRVDQYQIGRMAATFFFDQQDSPNSNIILEPELVIRESSGSI